MRLLCFLTGHHLGRPFHLLGIEVRSCVHCGSVAAGKTARGLV